MSQVMLDRAAILMPFPQPRLGRAGAKLALLLPTEVVSGKVAGRSCWTYRGCSHWGWCGSPRPRRCS